jgi:hypothetical protein
MQISDPRFFLPAVQSSAEILADQVSFKIWALSLPLYLKHSEAGVLYAGHGRAEHLPIGVKLSQEIEMGQAEHQHKLEPSMSRDAGMIPVAAPICDIFNLEFCLRCIW